MSFNARNPMNRPLPQQGVIKQVLLVAQTCCQLSKPAAD
jgi:hypothetical protein